MTETGKYLIARKAQLEILNQCRENLRKNGRGSVVWVPAEAGYGKTALLTYFEEETRTKYSSLSIVYAQTQAPIGTTRIGSLQPLFPFTRIVEQLAKKESVSPEKKLAFNIGMSVLGLIPVVGEFPFLVKELRRDIQEFKSEKKSGKSYSTAATELYEVLKNYAQKAPLILLFDDMHYTDAQSVEVLSLFLSDIVKLPVMIVIAYRPAAAKDVISPLLPLYEEYKPDSATIYQIRLTELTTADITKSCQGILSHYKKHEEFEQWLWAKSSGIPGLLFEYLHYFSKKTPFDEQGQLIANFHDDNIVPTSLHSTFARLVEQLDDDERTLLALCSAEGRECTVHIVSKLLNTDTLTTIRKMRSVQRKTGIVTSIGAQNRYGIKTTVYQFTQAFYQQFFHNTLEYEEKVTLHRQIAELLRMQYTDSEDETVRRALAPYIVAHDIESDNDDSQEFINETRELAAASGNTDIMQQFTSSFTVAAQSKQNPDADHTKDDIKPESMTIFDLQKKVVDAYLMGNIGGGVELCQTWLHENHTAHAGDRAMCCALQARCLIELGELSHARQLCEQGFSLVQIMPNPIAECLLNNAMAIALHHENNDAAEYYLLKAAQPSPFLSPAYRLMTITNISALLQNRSSNKAQKFKKSALELAKSLHFHTFINENFEKSE
jgi:adenylate cyclase